MKSFFWSSEHLSSISGIALASNELSITYSELNKRVDEYSKFLSEHDLSGQLAFLPIKTDIDGVIRYLACLRQSIVPLLLPANIDSKLSKNLFEIYKPAICFGKNNIYDNKIFKPNISSKCMPENLAILLSTSGSTGSAKLVKLSHKNIQSNAESICMYLKIKPGQKAHCTLPLSYSFGLSVINSHLQSGSCVYLSELNPLSPGYYEELIRENITSISGVPFFYQMLIRTGFLEKELPALTVMTQAGGKLSNKLIEKFLSYTSKHNINFYIMYGQTEATARISYVPSNMLSQKIGSIGIAIPNGKLCLSDDGELIYSGPNVMLGYANNKQDLNSEYNNDRKLYTGDVATQDEDGFYYIVGRLKRFLKLAGSRFGLDEIENFLEDTFDKIFIVSGEDDKLVIVIEDKKIDISLVYSAIQSTFAINRAFVKINLVEKIARKANGKKDYAFYSKNQNE